MDFSACRYIWVRSWWQVILHDRLICLKLHIDGRPHNGCRGEELEFLDRYLLCSPDLQLRHVGDIMYSANVKRFNALVGLERFFA